MEFALAILCVLVTCWLPALTWTVVSLVREMEDLRDEMAARASKEQRRRDAF